MTATRARIARLTPTLGLLDLFKGLDFEETALTWTTAALLARGRVAFSVDHDAVTPRSAVWRVPLGRRFRPGPGRRGGLGLARPSLADLGRARDRGPVRWQAGPLQLHDMPLAAIIHAIEVGTLLAIANAIFRPLTSSTRARWACRAPGWRRCGLRVSCPSRSA